jgi:hypothetical protein
MATSNDLTKQGIAALKADDKQRAAAFLKQAIQADKNNQVAWLWLSGCVVSIEEKRECLEHVLSINDTSEVAQQAKKGLAQLPKPEPPKINEEEYSSTLSLEEATTQLTESKASPVLFFILLLATLVLFVSPFWKDSWLSEVIRIEGPMIDVFITILWVAFVILFVFGIGYLIYGSFKNKNRPMGKNLEFIGALILGLIIVYWLMGS